MGAAARVSRATGRVNRSPRARISCCVDGRGSTVIFSWRWTTAIREDGFMPASPFRASAPLTTEWDHFVFSVEDGVATVRLNRPEKFNPLTFDSYADLRDLLHELP